jgi:hypothetical protein
MLSMQVVNLSSLFRDPQRRLVSVADEKGVRFGLSHRRVSPIGHLIGLSLIGMHLP